MVNLLSKTDKVRIKGKGTDLTMSIKNMPVRKDAGLQNLPDGEVYCIPVKHSINGMITFNTPVNFRGTTFDNIVLTFEDGKITDAKANETTKLLEILEIDEGARFIGEFGIGLNPYIWEPMNDILFDEKFGGVFTWQSAVLPFNVRIQTFLLYIGISCIINVKNTVVDKFGLMMF